MQREDLLQVYNLKREINMWTDELIELEAKSKAKAQPTYVLGGRSGLPSDSTGTLGVKMAETKSIIEKKLNECQDAVNMIMRFIDTIDDSLLRQIVFQRCIRCRTWNQVAYSIGGGNTADGVRKRFDRAFPKK